MDQKRPLGVYIFGVGLITTSLANMLWVVTHYGDYRAIYSHWPYGWFIARYSFSIFQRVVGLTAGVGILCFKDFARKLAFVIGCFTISTIYIKHPYFAYKNHTAILDQQVAPILRAYGLPISFSPWTFQAMFLNCLLDVGFWLVFIYYFTRPQIKSLFKS